MPGATHSVCIVADDLTGTMDTSQGSPPGATARPSSRYRRPNPAASTSIPTRRYSASTPTRGTTTPGLQRRQSRTSSGRFPRKRCTRKSTRRSVGTWRRGRTLHSPRRGLTSHWSPRPSRRRAGRRVTASTTWTEPARRDGVRGRRERTVVAGAGGRLRERRQGRRTGFHRRRRIRGETRSRRH